MLEWQKSIGKEKCDAHEWDNGSYEKYSNNCFDFAQLITKSAHKGIYNNGNLSSVNGMQKLGLEKVGGWIYNNPTKIAS